ncbi:MAG: 23S rRNA (adenine(2503)-C(2))-methyltransferase RlmN [Paludibacteraceae bacterium]|mgnify:FL=1|nr:23S rRNA (adenine(2503)-C(2))-methyltransferase RlmN [Paludibacteraceae bacterium]MBP8966272.1 23S rRNA (adenine(2503)-C(2))-methyltransferase RlmN [Paludibacteraceae bacterium]HOJ65779.1 23S rRNA (adenine(2503)-C(2))-methyltransferase RlmN [Paludibacteraceae bacterium]HPL76100.1 23S rRNA (adenine(2503)-C(2))-methyltransferase RlmN [Paludibacteraceae bacterium]
MPIPLLGASLEELTDIVSQLKMPTYTAKQISDWLYKKRVADINEMSNISVKNRDLLKEKYKVGRLAPVKVTVSKDETKKYLFRTEKDHFIETVFIPEEHRNTLCVSSQIGCKMNCVFCMTGKQGFMGQLSASEILNQILSVPEAEKITNLVFMGMGEPFDNTVELLRTLNILTANYGYAWSPYRITVSTIGLIPGMQTFLEKSNCNLAISLHSPFHSERLELMPIEKAYPISQVVEVLKNYNFGRQRKLSFEYIMFDKFNDTMRHASELVRLLKGMNARVNLIRFHAIPNVSLRSSSDERMKWFCDYLNNNGILATIRKSRGEDISAACGLLSTLENKKMS